jgi:tRNA-specific 2-thiouridylase
MTPSVTPGSGQRVAVGLSGGVDSALAAALLADQGFDVVATHLRLWGGDDERSRRSADSARQIAHHIGIPFRIVDARELFRSVVIDHFVAEYAAGRTPNPCTVCNPRVKFRLLTGVALEENGGYAATGHYARVRRDGDCFVLLRGVDLLKDQSYFLYALGQSQLARILFPLGSLTKREVRAAARRRRLPVSGLPESQDICFVPRGDYRAFLTEVVPDLGCPGPILDAASRVLGEHRGLPAYTIGQRKGLGISSDRPLYVTRIDTTRNALTVGPAEDLLQDAVFARQVSYVSGRDPQAPFEAVAQIRYGGRPTPVTVFPEADTAARVRFSSPLRAVSPGQSLVLYDGDVVLGGGVIDSVL